MRTRGLVTAPGELFSVMGFAVTHEKIVEIDIQAVPSAFASSS